MSILQLNENKDDSEYEHIGGGDGGRVTKKRAKTEYQKFCAKIRKEIPMTKWIKDESNKNSKYTGAQQYMMEVLGPMWQLEKEEIGTKPKRRRVVKKGQGAGKRCAGGRLTKKRVGRPTKKKLGRPAKKKVVKRRKAIKKKN